MSEYLPQGWIKNSLIVFLDELSPCTIEDLKTAFGMLSYSQVSTAVSILLREGRVKRVKGTKGIKAHYLFVGTQRDVEEAKTFLSCLPPINKNDLIDLRNPSVYGRRGSVVSRVVDFICDGNPFNVPTLVRNLGITSSSASNVVQKLKLDGLVCKTTDSGRAQDTTWIYIGEVRKGVHTSVTATLSTTPAVNKFSLVKSTVMSQVHVYEDGSVVFQEDDTGKCWRCFPREVVEVMAKQIIEPDGSSTLIPA